MSDFGTRRQYRTHHKPHHTARSATTNVYRTHSYTHTHAHIKGSAATTRSVPDEAGGAVGAVDGVGVESVAALAVLRRALHASRVFYPIRVERQRHYGHRDARRPSTSRTFSCVPILRRLSASRIARSAAGSWQLASAAPHVARDRPTEPAVSVSCRFALFRGFAPFAL